MKHLFIVNPAADGMKGKVDAVVNEIVNFFQSYTHFTYDIHVTRWRRDAVGFTHRYVVNSEELVRVYAVGGTGTLFEIVNGVIGLPNVQVAFYPLGSCNSFLRYFGKDKFHLFQSLRNLVFSGVTAIDALRGGKNYGICSSAIGMEAVANRDGDVMKSRISLTPDYLYLCAAVYQVLRNKDLGSSYKVTLDGQTLDGDYVTILTANEPYYGTNFHPAVDAHPGDGRLELYLVKDMPRVQFCGVMPIYLKGNYRKRPEQIVHRSGRIVSIESDEVMCITLDGEIFYDTSIEYEIIPYAIDFVCPEGVHVNASSEGVMGDGEYER